MQRDMLDTLREYNEDHLSTRGDNSNLAARIASYELAYRMQATAPDVVDMSREDAATQQLYGLDDKKTEVFGRQCLLARRLVERGVRFVQIYSGGATTTTTGTRTAIWSPTMSCTPARPTSRSPVCSRI